MKCRVQIGDESFPTYLFFLLKSYSFLALLAPFKPRNSGEVSPSSRLL